MNYIRLALQFMTPVSIRIVLAIVFIFFIWLYFIPADHLDDYSYATEVLHFLKSNKHEHLKTQLHHLKINNPVQLAKLSISDGAWVKAALQHSSPQALTEVTKISNLMYQHLLLKQWLVTNKILNYEHKLHSLEINSLEKFHDVEDDIIRVVTVGDSTLTDYKAMLNAVKSLRSTQNMQVLKHNLWSIVAKENWNPKWSYGHLFIFILIGVIVIICTELYSHTTDTVRFYDLLLGNYLAVRTCNVSWHWEDPAEVGNTMEFTTYFHLMNGRKCKLTTRDKVLIEVMTGTSKIPVTLHFPDNGNTSLANASFTVRQAGVYYVSVMVNAEHVMGSPFKKTFKAGNIDAGKSHFIGQSSIVMCTAGTCHPMILETCDQFGNSCDYDPKKHFPDHYVLQINKVGSDVVETPNLEIAYETSSHKLILRLVVNEEGCYNAVALYNGEPIGNGHFTLIVLNDEDTETMRMAVKKKSTWFESRQLGYDPEKPHKSRKVYCFVSPKQFTVKEYYLKYIPRRLYTFRVCPTTKISFSTSDSRCDLPIFTVDDGCQFNITLAAKERNIIGACFSTHLIKNIGGSESFSDKCNYFYNEIRDLHKHRHHSEIILKIQREQLLASSYKATKHFSTSQWCKKFNIHFEGEQGLDYGGVGREWIDLLCTAIFDPLATGMFTSFAESSQGLAHPSKCIPSDFSLKHYEFAGKLVGKCIYESSLGGIYTRLVKARFTRSFLAQLIGLRITYKYFEQDDPQLYISKIKYILENEVEDMDLYFTEEEYKGYQLEAVVNLIPNGNQIQVNDQNKIQYLNALAQYKLSVCSKAAIGAFLKGLNELIPDELLSIFDENELELLICGTGDYSIADFKQNHVTSNMVNAQVLNWFWTVVSGFTQEEMARLLQFATGSSQLPPGGFGQLDPPFRISSTLTFGNLPTAHTCFHQLCLPGYASFDDFRQSLLLAITEGSQGFGLV